MSWMKKRWGDLDVDELIEAVFQRPAIWDRNNRQHSSRGTVDRLWSEIQAEMGIDENLLRKKWKYLRDQFATEWGKSEKLSSDKNTPISSRWQYYNQLLFLKGIVKPRVKVIMSSAVDPETKQEPLEQDESREWMDSASEEEEEQENFVDGEPADGSDVSRDGADGASRRQENSANLYNRKRKADEAYDVLRKNLGRIERKLHDIADRTNPSVVSSSNANPSTSVATTSGRSEAEGEDLLFLKSLLPHITQIPMNKKLGFRSRVMQLVEEFAYPATQGAEGSSLT